MIMVRIDLMALWLNEGQAPRRGTRRGNGKGYEPQWKGGKGKGYAPQGNGEEDRTQGQTAASSNDAVQPEPGCRWRL